MRVSCRHWSVKIGAVFFYSRKEDKDGKKRQGDTDATGDRWVKCEELRFRGDGACFAWRKATVDEIVEHFKNR